MSNNETKTNLIFEKLKIKAEDNLKKELESASSCYNKALGLSGICEDITLTDKRTGKSIKIYTTDIYNQINEFLFEKRKESRTKNEIEIFLKEVSTLSAQLEILKDLSIQDGI